MSARSSAPRPSPPSSMGVSPIGLTAATPTKGEILVHLGAMSRKPQSAKRKKSNSTEKDRLVPAKVQKVGASPASPAREPERASSPRAEAPLALSSPPPSKTDLEANSLLGAAAEQSLAAMPITIWNPPIDEVKSPPRREIVLKRKKVKPRVDENKDSLLSNAELEVSDVSSILKDSDLGRSKGLPVDEALTLSLQGVSSVSL